MAIGSNDPIGGSRLWDPDPERGCGRKVHGGFYLESGPGSFSGGLSLVTLCTGDLRLGGENILCNVPPRGAHIFYPVDTFRLGEIQLSAAPTGTPAGRKSIEQIATIGTKAVGIVDHVGSNNYTPVSFIQELHQHGASRRVTRKMAEDVMRLMQTVGAASIPIFFSHSDIPLLTDNQELSALMYTEEILGVSTSSSFLPASYTHPKWGMRRQKWGGIWEEQPAAAWRTLVLMDAAREAPPDSRYFRARHVFDNARYQEQLFCASWIKAVTYVTRTGEVPGDIHDAGFTVLDLSNSDQEEE